MLRLDNIGRLKDTGKVPRTALTTNLLPVIFLSTSTSNERSEERRVGKEC